MEEVHGGGTGVRRNEDIALDLMKFVAMTTGYGRTTSSGVGFQGTGAAAKPEEYAGHLLEFTQHLGQFIAISHAVIRGKLRVRPIFRQVVG